MIHILYTIYPNKYFLFPFENSIALRSITLTKIRSTCKKKSPGSFPKQETTHINFYRYITNISIE